jgi:putative aminopeptidase FrvX
MKTKEFKDICEVVGVSGYEEPVRKMILSQIKSNVDSVTVDNSGNVIAKKKGNKKGPIIMFAAHMDELGMVVTYIEKEGYLRFWRLGGIDTKLLLDQSVIVHGKRALHGVIATKPPHLQKKEEAEKVVKKEELYIDIGAKDKKQIEKLGIEKGTVVSFEPNFKELLNDTYCCKAVDNRAGVFILLQAAKALKKDFAGTVYFVFSTQEETGCKGARTAAYRINPDLALVVDVSNAGDYPYIKPVESEGVLGKGPSITFMEAEGHGAVVPQKVRKFMVQTAKKSKIPYQISLTTGGMTDAAVIQLLREGMLAGIYGPPMRYMHSTSGIIAKKDIESSIKLTLALIKEAPKFF